MLCATQFRITLIDFHFPANGICIWVVRTAQVNHNTETKIFFTLSTFYKSRLFHTFQTYQLFLLLPNLIYPADNLTYLTTLQPLMNEMKLSISIWGCVDSFNLPLEIVKIESWTNQSYKPMLMWFI